MRHHVDREAANIQPVEHDSPPYVFDAYGTLLDVSAAVTRHADAIGSDAHPLTELWRAKQLEYTWVLSLMGAYAPFWELTERALDSALARFPRISPELRGPLLNAYRSLDPYPEVPAVLSELRARGGATAVLSNGDSAMLAGAFDAAGLTSLLDRILSVEVIRVFKTAPAAYGLVTTAFPVHPGQVTFVSANRWDVAGAASAGFRAVWVNRAGLPDEYASFAPFAVVSDLRGVLDLPPGQ